MFWPSPRLLRESALFAVPWMTGTCRPWRTTFNVSWKNTTRAVLHQFWKQVGTWKGFRRTLMVLSVVKLCCEFLHYVFGLFKCFDSLSAFVWSWRWPPAKRRCWTNIFTTVTTVGLWSKIGCCFPFFCGQSVSNSPTYGILKPVNVIYIYTPAPPKRCQYDPKGWLMGTPYHSFSTP